MTEYEFVKVDVQAQVAIVTMDRPPVNAVSIGLSRDLAAALQDLDGHPDEVRAVILTGAGRCFCAGRDIKVAETEPPEVRARFSKASMSAIYRCSMPIIAAVNGPAMGGGYARAALCDLIIASERAVFAMPEIDSGLNPSVAMLLRGLNQYQARAMAFTGERYTAADMHRMGVVRSVVPHDELLPRALELAATLAGKSPLALRAARWSANEVELLFRDFEQAYRAIEQRVSVAHLQTDDHLEAVAAFTQKRPPVFTGR